MLFASLTAALILAFYLQARNVRWQLAIPLAALLVPLAVLFGAIGTLIGLCLRTRLPHLYHASLKMPAL